MHSLVLGGGIFGVTAALALRARGHDVTVVEPGPLPHPLAESTDISKVVRMDYGADEDYTALGETALAGWRAWNARWPRPLFHETGVTFLARAAIEPGGFERDSYDVLVRRGHRLERLDAAAIAKRFPAYAPGAYVDGYFNPEGGWAASGAVVAQLAREADSAGVVIRAARADRLVDGGAVIDGEIVRADLVVVCAGSWVPLLVPELASCLRAVGQPVFHLAPRDPSLFEAARFPVFGADISRTGYYGFPLNDGVVKIANHGAGVTLPASADAAARVVTAAHESALRAMLAGSFPALADAPIVFRRLCVYCDTFDEHFWIARDPARPNVAVATGGSGHAFKFAPVLGDLIATLALGEPHPLAAKFRWRPELVSGRGAEAARHHG
ncbi:MAG TPA: FAD-dependent oxidoreductase [Kofleriaceae bacterium]|nr:FAD-dependent oxidoreductase [Kofleriaceae bacterium]